MFSESGYRSTNGDVQRKGGQFRPPARSKRESGQAVLELALVTPFIFFLIILAINFGGWLYAWTQVGNAARAAANYAVLGPSSAGSPVTPNGTAITTMLAADLATLPNYSSSNPSVAVCWNNNGTVTSITGTCSSPPADPEGGSYIAVSVDLTYTYTPFVTSFTFSNLGIQLPTMLTSLHRRVVMRFL
jgi:Flp pilus assembly protein TadG